MPVLTTRRAAALCVAALAAVVASPTQASAATPVAGTYTLHYEHYSAPGYWSTTQLVLNPDQTCSIAAGCMWTVSQGTFTITLPNVRRNGSSYVGVVTPTGLCSSAHPGYIYYGTTGNTPEGLWYATR